MPFVVGQRFFLWCVKLALSVAIYPIYDNGPFTLGQILYLCIIFLRWLA